MNLFHRENHNGEPKRLEKQPLTEAQKRKREKILMIVLIVTAVFMVLAATLVVLFNRWVQKPDLPAASTASASASPDPDASRDPNESPDPEETLDIDAVEPLVSGERRSDEIYTILVVGADIVSDSTDTMMVVTYDISNQRATVMSIPRDTLVNVRTTGSIYTRINSIYSLYGRGDDGLDALTREISKLIGFTPDFRIVIDWELVGEMVDAIGGVWYDVPYRMKYDDPDQDLHIDQEQGYRLLDGKDAMEVVRWRKNNYGVSSNGGDGSDLTRLKVQHGFLKAVLKQTLQIQNVVRIGELAELFGNRVESDLTVENLFWFASQAIFGGLNVDDVEFTTMPVYAFGPGGQYVCPIQGGLLTLINDKLNPYVENVTMRQLDLITGNSDGSLSSSTGRLADSRAAQPQEWAVGPTQSQAPEGNQNPAASNEPTDLDPVESDPGQDDPWWSEDPNAGQEPPPMESDPFQEEPQTPPWENGGAPWDTGTEQGTDGNDSEE